MAKSKIPEFKLRRPAVDVKRLAQGGYVLRSPHAPGSAPTAPLDEDAAGAAAAIEGLWLWPPAGKLKALVRAEGGAVAPVMALLDARKCKLKTAAAGTGTQAVDAAGKAITKIAANIHVDTAEGLSALLPRLEQNSKMRRAFTKNLALVITVDGLIQPTARALLGKLVGDVPLLGLWGHEATGRTITVLAGDDDSEDNLGLPLPGGFMRLAGNGETLELWTARPGNTTPVEPGKAAYAATRLKVKFLDPMRPYRGLVLDA